MRIPTAGALDAPTQCAQINIVWLGYLLGALELLNRDSRWTGTDAEVFAARQNVESLMRAFALGECEGASVSVELPIGGIIQFYGTLTDDRFRLCNGDLLDTAEYPAIVDLPLVPVYDYENDIIYRQLPDMRGRFPLGAGDGPGLSSRTNGAIGGAETVILQESHLPPHSHAINARNAPYTGSGAVDRVARGLQSAGGSSTVTQSAGGGQEHENMPPFLVLTFYMRVK